MSYVHAGVDGTHVSKEVLRLWTGLSFLILRHIRFSMCRLRIKKKRGTSKAGRIIHNAVSKSLILPRRLAIIDEAKNLLDFWECLPY